MYCLPHALNLCRTSVLITLITDFSFSQWMNVLWRMSLHLQVVNETLDCILLWWPSCVAFGCSETVSTISFDTEFKYMHSFVCGIIYTYINIYICMWIYIYINMRFVVWGQHFKRMVIFYYVCGNPEKTVKKQWILGIHMASPLYQRFLDIICVCACWGLHSWRLWRGRWDMCWAFWVSNRLLLGEYI